MKKIIVLVTSLAMMCGTFSVVQAKNSYDVKRIYGENRYETSLNVLKNFSQDKLENVIISSGKDFPDALAGSGLSKALNAPILLVDEKVSENLDALNYIERHLNSNGSIYILGGKAAVNEEYVEYFKSLGYKNIIRMGGNNRFDTNRIIVNNMNIKKGTPVVIVNAYGFADALSVSSAAASKGYPILMSDSKNLSQEIKSKIKEIQPSQVFLIGGESCLGNDIISELKNVAPVLNDSSIVRIYGMNRYETSLEICKYFNLDSETAVISNGENFPDALSGSSLAAKNNAPIILTDGEDILKQKNYIDGTKYKNLILLGGKGAISKLSEDILNGSINELDSIKSKSDYTFNIRNSKGVNFSGYLYSYDKEVAKVKEFSSTESWAQNWQGASEGDILSKGHYKIALVKEGESEPEIFDFNNNEEFILNLNKKYIKTIKSTGGDTPDFMMMLTPMGNDVVDVKAYYIKEGKLSIAKFKEADQIKETINTFNLVGPFLNLREDNTVETSSFKMEGKSGYYISSWKFNLEKGYFECIGTRFMNKDEYVNYLQSIK